MLKKDIVKGLFVTMAGVIFIFTSWLTKTFISSVLVDAPFIVPWVGVIIFDGGFLGWMLVHVHLAKGKEQRAISLVICVIDLIGLSFMVIAEVLLGGQSLTAAPPMLNFIAVWVIPIWTVFNTAAFAAYHFADPGIQQEMKDRAIEGKLQEVIQSQYEEKVIAAAPHVADVKSNHKVNELILRITGDGNEEAKAPQPKKLTPTPSHPEIIAAQGPAKVGPTVTPKKQPLPPTTSPGFFDPHEEGQEVFIAVDNHGNPTEDFTPTPTR